MGGLDRLTASPDRAALTADFPALRSTTLLERVALTVDRLVVLTADLTRSLAFASPGLGGSVQLPALPPPSMGLANGVGTQQVVSGITAFWPRLPGSGRLFCLCLTVVDLLFLRSGPYLINHK